MIEFMRGTRMPVEEGGKESAVRRGDARPVDLPLQDGQLVAQRQQLDFLVDVADRQQPYDGEHARHGEVGQSQQHDRSACHALSGDRQPFARTCTSRPRMGFPAPAGPPMSEADWGKLVKLAFCGGAFALGWAVLRSGRHRWSTSCICHTGTEGVPGRR
jgi:hypothetical protein